MNCTKCECEKCIADGAAAGEAWSDEQELITALLLQRRFDCPHCEPPCGCAKIAAAIDDRVDAALARVDARRGGGS